MGTTRIALAPEVTMEEAQSAKFGAIISR
jgi:hypothetical protein